MKRFDKDDIVGICNECKEDVLCSEGFVVTKKNKLYHLSCYCIINDFVEIDEIGEDS
jgi:hypothetical protein